LVLGQKSQIQSRSFGTALEAIPFAAESVSGRERSFQDGKRAIEK
jgi:hypothetical protein